MSIRTYLQRRRNSFGYAAHGIRIAVATQAHARLHLLAAIGVVFLGWVLEVSALEWCALLLAIAMVCGGEMLNTAVELAVDLASPAQHPLAGQAKDVAAGAVLVISCLAALVGAIIFIPKLIALV